MFHLILLFCLFDQLVAKPVLVHREEFERITRADGKVIKIEYHVNQNCDIQNLQKNLTHAIENGSSEPKPKESWWQKSSLSSLWGPIGLGALSILGYGIYYAITKLNLYTLTKACLTNAVWSAWKQKKHEGFDTNDKESDLLIDILNTYETDRYGVAIAQFMQDVEREIDLLEQYIAAASNAQTGIFKFAFGDFSQEILQAKARLSQLHELKKIVLSWLHKKSFSFLQDEEVMIYLEPLA